MFLTYVLIHITNSMKCIVNWTISRFLTTLRNRINSVLVPSYF
uniref:MATA-HMG n=1 Tax=Rhizophagus irregularis TaxID=588596 RepID=A0A1B1ETS5_9GLOM|nr:MATA-HMG [Rhizophagus irregularis]